MTNVKGKNRVLGVAVASSFVGLCAATSNAAVIAYYSFDNASNLGQDTSGNGLNLTASGGPTAVAGQVNGAASFDGADDIFQRSAASVYTATPNLSVSFFAAPDAAGTNTISRPSGSNTGGLTFTTSTTSYNANFNSATNVGLNSNVAPVANTYTHVVLTFADADGVAAGGLYTGTGTLYVNGVQVAQNASVTYTPNGGVFAIGGRGNSTTGTNFFAGDVDEFATYDQTLTAAQAAALADGSATPLTVVPEPATLGVVGLGTLVATSRRRRR